MTTPFGSGVVPAEPDAATDQDALTSPDSGSKDVKAHMVEIAERMFSERGLDGVSMRDVAGAAGQRNNSAVQYHFGSRDGLIVAVLRGRMITIHADRLERLRAADEAGLGSDVRTLLEVLLEPFVDAIRRSPQPTHYCRFLAKVGPLVGPTIPEITDVRTGSDDVVSRLIGVLDQVPKRTAFERIDLAMQMFIGALAVHEDRQHSVRPVEIADFERTVAHLYDMTLAGLLAVESTSRGGRKG